MSAFPITLDKEKLINGLATDAGNDVFASVMIYNRLMEMAAENGIKVNQRMCLVEEGATSRQTVTVQKERVVSGDTLAKSLRSFMMFAMGDDLETIGKAMRSPEQPLAPGTIRLASGLSSHRAELTSCTSTQAISFPSYIIRSHPQDQGQTPLLPCIVTRSPRIVQ